MAVFQAGRPREIGEEAPVPVWPKSAVRIVFGLMFSIDAYLKWIPGFHKQLLSIVQGAADGQPSWLHWWFKFWIDTIQPHPRVWAYAIAVVETLLALALVFGFARKITYILTAITTFMIWAIAEGFGGPYTPMSTDIGAGIMYSVVALSLLVLALQVPDRYSLDYYLEQRVPWWHWLAEVGRHNHPPAHSATSSAVAPTPGATATE